MKIGIYTVWRKLVKVGKTRSSDHSSLKVAGCDNAITRSSYTLKAKFETGYFESFNETHRCSSLLEAQLLVLRLGKDARSSPLEAQLLVLRLGKDACSSPLEAQLLVLRLGKDACSSLLEAQLLVLRLGKDARSSPLEAQLLVLRLGKALLC